MFWFSKNFIRNSERNGRITVYRDFFGPWQISVNECGQTTSYTHTMWVDTFRRLRYRFVGKKVENILMLGLGAGGEISTLHTQFPDCRITVVEYDPVIISLAKELQIYKPFPFPKILQGDAASIVPGIKEKFDLIIVDLFNGPEPSVLGTDVKFLQSLQQILTKRGTTIINVYKRKDYLDTPKELFPFSSLWNFRLNNLGVFWQE